MNATKNNINDAANNNADNNNADNSNENDQIYRTDMNRVFQQLHATKLYCDNCTRVIVKTIYRLRRTNMKCCSGECADEYGRYLKC